jgi:hypothetical protein
VLLVEGEADDDCFDDGSFFIDLLILLSRLVRLKLNIAKKPILCYDHIEVILFDTEYFDRHNHISLESIWSLFEQVEKDFFVFHDSFRISCISKAPHDFTLYKLFIVKRVVLHFPIDRSNPFWVFK